jgi:hypothetical protein
MGSLVIKYLVLDSSQQAAASFVVAGKEDRGDIGSRRLPPSSSGGLGKRAAQQQGALGISVSMGFGRRCEAVLGRRARLWLAPEQKHKQKQCSRGTLDWAPPAPRPCLRRKESGLGGAGSNHRGVGAVSTIGCLPWAGLSLRLGYPPWV